MTWEELITKAEEHARAAGMDDFSVELSNAVARSRQKRASLLVRLSETKSPVADSCQLTALAELGIEYAKSEVVECLFRTHVDGVSNQALAILVDWNEQELGKRLQELLELRYGQAFGLRSRARALFAGLEKNDTQPRQY